MAHISVKISQSLYNKIKKKAKDLGGSEPLHISDTVRFLLQSALKDNDSFEDSKIKDKQLQYIAGTYYLINELILSQGEKGKELNKIAHHKAENVVAELLK